MGTLEQLRRDILRMTPEQQLERIRQIRAERWVSKNPEKEKKARKQNAQSHDKLLGRLKGMTKAQLKELGLVP